MLDFMYATENQESYDSFISSLTCDYLVDVLGPILEEDSESFFIVDEEGNNVEVSGEAKIKDPRIHFNLRVISELTSEEIAALKNHTQAEWISPEIVHSPRRVWFGGMFYA